MGLKGRILLMCAALGAAAVWGCAPNNQNHAPVCPYGQVLSYSQAGYNCNFVSLVPAGYNTLQTAAQPVGPGSVLNPPIAQCPGGQTLVNWEGTWLCYFTQTLYPPGGSSPQTPVPPAGLGGEYCTSGGVGVTPYYGGYAGGVNPYSYTQNLVVTCSPGFMCQPGGSAAGTVVGGVGMSYGTPGTCVYSGYQGTY